MPNTSFFNKHNVYKHTEDDFVKKLSMLSIGPALKFAYQLKSVDA